MMKKMMAVMLAGMITIGVAGCGSTQGAAPRESSAEVQSETKTESETETKAETKKAAVKIGEFDKSTTIEETVLIDQDDIKVTATKLSFTNYSAEVFITIENNSSQDLSFVAGSLAYSCNSVNGYMVSDGYLNEDVAAGKKTNEEVSFSLNELQAYGINSIADIEIGIYTTDPDYKSTIYEPKKILTSAADSYDYETDTYKQAVEDGVWETLADCEINYWNTDQIYNQENASIESVALITNKDGEQSFFIEFVNNSEQMVNAAISSVAINDLVLYGGAWSSDSINPGARDISDIKVSSLLDKEYQDLINVGDISSLAFDLVLRDSENNDLTEEETIRISLTDKASSYAVSGTPVLENEGIKLTEIGIVKDEDSYSSYAFHIFYAVENGTSKRISADCGYDSLSINGYMIDFYDFSGSVPADTIGLLRIDLDKDDLESAGITSADDIKDMEFTLKVTDDNYNKILEETVTSIR